MFKATLRYLLDDHATRTLACVALTLLVLVALVRWWPAPDDPVDEAMFAAQTTDEIEIQEIQPTAQRQVPPPPAPLPPEVVPDDVILEEDPIDFADATLEVDEPDDDPDKQEGIADPGSSAQVPDVDARLLRYVEPDYTESARSDDVRARVVVEVEVDPEGHVEEASILERMLLDEEGDVKQRVEELGYGLDEAALSAARRSLFRPAESGGEPVATRTTITIRFGV